MKLTENKYINLSDENLMAFIRNKDKKAFSELYSRYYKKMINYFMRMLNDSEKAKDLLHDLFLKIIEKNSQFDTDKKFSTWIYTIAYNQCKNEFRRKTYIKNYEIEPQEIAYNPDYALFDRNILMNNLAKELNLLSLEHRTTVMLRYFEEMSIKDISNIMNCPEGTTRSRIYYALKLLSEKLKIFTTINN